MGRSNRRDREGTPRRRPVTWPRVPRCKARIRPLGVAMAKAGRGWVGRGGVRGKGSRAEARKDQRMRSAVVSPPPPPRSGVRMRSRAVAAGCSAGGSCQRGLVQTPALHLFFFFFFHGSCLMWRLPLKLPFSAVFPPPPLCNLRGLPDPCSPQAA